MWKQIIYFAGVVAVCVTEMTAPGIDRDVSDGVKSMGYNILYGDEDMTIINQVVNDMEKSEVLKTRLNEAIPALPAQDVKCLMSVDRYCSKEMGQMKSVLLSAIREDCVRCSVEEKDKAGRIIASMLAHDPVAWKLFLSRSALQSIPPKQNPPVKRVRFESYGKPEEVVKSPYRYTKPGFNVRVKRYGAQIVREL